MLKINFHSDSDREDFAHDVKEYEEIWQSDGQVIVDTWEKATGLQFKETFINAIIYPTASHSHPLILRSGLSVSEKKMVLVHELGHRLYFGRINGMRAIDTMGHHKFLDLVLHDVYIEIYGADFQKEAVIFEDSLAGVYKTAREWALGFSKEERIILFKEILAGDLSKIK